MPSIHAFPAIRFAPDLGPDLSRLIAPPYDVLDAPSRARLLTPPEGDARNIVAIDLPHTPAKELGPPEAYAHAADLYRRHLATGTLIREPAPVMLAYRQTLTPAPGASPVRRHGLIACVDLAPFGPRPGGGILPHEETFSGPKQDRLALMRATRAQLSPIFGLHADERGGALALLERLTAARAPDATAASLDGTRHEVWTLRAGRPHDDRDIAEYQQLLAGEDVFIADGHHRYTTQLTYAAELDAARHASGLGPLPDGHPARRCMMVLVSMRDPGLVIWPTHRLLGGLRDYSWDALLRSLREHGLDVAEPISTNLTDLDPAHLHDPARFRNFPARPAGNVLGLYDPARREYTLAAFREPDPLRDRFPHQPEAWRTLDVALVQHILVEEIVQPRFNANALVTWAFPHTLDETEAIARGEQTGAGGFTRERPAQVAILVRPTPLAAVREVSRAGGLMPQKSTFFYPKLATGLAIHALEDTAAPGAG